VAVIWTRVAVILVTLALEVGVPLQAYRRPDRDATDAAGALAQRNPEPARIANPVAADATSLAAGKQLFEKNCASCHGRTGKGDGAMGEELNPKPADLTSAERKHGSSDGEIFTVIKDGVKGTGMKSFNSKVTTHQIWDLVNYVRSLSTPAKSH
jgi:mono/diheme cytochrome c family protein